MDYQQTLSIPTKRADSDDDDGPSMSLNEILGRRGVSTGVGASSTSDAARRMSSGSNESLDVAASIFNSMRTLEESGRRLSDLEMDNNIIDGDNNNLATSSLMNHRLATAAGMGTLFPSAGISNINSSTAGAGLGTMGMGRFGSNNLCQPVSAAFFPPASGMGDSMMPQITRQEIEYALMRRQLLENRINSATPLLDVMRGGYRPLYSSTGGNATSSLDLVNQFSRYQSERSNAPALLDDRQSHNSTDSLQAKIDLLNSSQMQSAATRRGSTDSLELLAETAKVDAMREKAAVPGNSKTNTTTQSNSGRERKVGDTLAITSIPTCFNPATKKGTKKRRKNGSSSSEGVSDVSESSSEGKTKKPKRSTSTSSFDALITAMGDDLAKLEEKKGKKDPTDKMDSKDDDDENNLLAVVRDGIQARRRSSKDTESVISCISYHELDTFSQIQDEIVSRSKERRSQLAALLDGKGINRPLIPMEPSAAMHHPTSAVNFDYTSRLQSSNSMMASLQSAMIQNDLFMRELALRDFQAQQEVASRMLLQSNGRSQILTEAVYPEPRLQLPQEKCSPSTKNMRVVPISDKTVKEDTNLIPPAEALKMFLSAYGEEGETLRDSLLKAISDTESSLASIHNWDRSQGLRKCHSRTVVKTRRSRAQIKAFLTGVEPPKEPHLNRKTRSKKKKTKKAMDAFATLPQRFNNCF